MIYYCVHSAIPYDSSRKAYDDANAAWDGWARKNRVEDNLAQAVRMSNAFLAAGETKQAVLEADPISSVSGKYKGARWWRA